MNKRPLVELAAKWPAMALASWTALATCSAQADDWLPPLTPWQGQSLALIQAKHPWVTPAELTNLTESAELAQMQSYLQKLVAQSDLLRLESIGKSPQGRDIWLVKASRQPEQIGKQDRPVLLGKKR